MSAIVYMNALKTGTDRFEEFKAMLPLPVTRARRGIGGYVTIDFGDQCGVDTMTGEPQYEWHLWVYMCDWDLKKGDARILWRRESDNALAGAVLQTLNGEPLQAVDYDSKDDCFAFRFSGGYSLHVDPDFFDYDGEDDLFMLFHAGDDYALNYSPRRRFYRAA